MEGGRDLVRNGKDRRQSLATAIWAGVILFAVLLFAQKVTGSSRLPTSTWVACLVATLAGIPSLLAWCLYVSTRPIRSRILARLTSGLLTLVPPLALGLTLLPAGSSSGIWYLAVLFGLSATVTLLTADGGSLFPADGGSLLTADGSSIVVRTSGDSPTGSLQIPPVATVGFRQNVLPAPVQAPGIPDRVQESERTKECLDLPNAGFVSLVDAGSTEFSQQLTRSNSAERGDLLAGVVTVHFAAGQKQTNVHVPFVPPFAAIPIVECECLEGCPVRSKLGLVQTYGLRIEIKRTGGCDTEETVELGISAFAAATTANAA